MPIANPQASVEIRAQVVPDPATEPNIGKEVEIAVKITPNLSAMNIAYVIQMTCTALSSGAATYALAMGTGDISGVTGSATAIRSGKDTFGNDLPTGQNQIGLLLVQAASTNNEVIKVEASAADGCFNDARIQPGKFALTDSEFTPGNLTFTFTAVGDVVTITVLSKNTV